MDKIPEMRDQINHADTLRKLEAEMPSEDATWEEMISSWMQLNAAELSIQWAKGTIVELVASGFGEMGLTEFAKEVGENVSTLNHYRRVVRAYAPEERNRNLPWSAYLEASFADTYDKGAQEFDGEERIDWLNEAEDKGWSVRELRRNMKEAGQRKDGDSEYDIVATDVRAFADRLIKREPEGMSPKQWKDIYCELETLLRKLYPRTIGG